jgi:DNA-binding NtrC family response regulator
VTLPAVVPPRVVLVVDDEEYVRNGLTRVLQDSGYTVFAAESGEEALQMLADHPIRLLISDNNMPGMSGLELFGEVRRRHPHVLRIMITGDADPDLPVRSINEAEVYRFIRKPWSNQDLRTIVRLAFEVLVLEDEKRRLLEIVRKHRAARSLRQAAPDDEAELLLLAEADLVES